MTDWLQTGSRDSAYGYADRLFMDRARRQSGAQVAQGNYRAAAAPLFAEGDLQTGNALIQQGAQIDAEAQKKQLDFTLQAARSLDQVRQQGGDVVAAYDSYAPAFRQMGVDDAQLGQFRQALSANPEQFLTGVQQIVRQQARELSFQKTGDNLLVFEEGNPDPVRQFAAPRQPINVGGVLVDPNSYEPILDTREPKYQTIQNSDGSSSLIAIDQPAPATTAGGRGGASRSSPSDTDVVGIVQSILPGARLTSGRRESDQNAAAGGAARSYHLQGQAIDLVPPPGVTLPQFRQQLEAQGVEVAELLDEGDHWHVAWRGGQQAPNIGRGERPQTRVVASGANNGPTPAAARADAREERTATRQARTDARQLRRDFESQDGVKEYETVRSSYNRLRALAASGSATDDTAIGYEFMRMLDPTSVVRESEYALVGQSQGIGGQALVALQRLSTGQRLTPELRRNLVETGERVFQGRQARYNELVDQYRGYAEEDGFDPDRVVPLRNGAESGNRQRSPRTNAPGLPFNVSEQQLSTRRRLSGSGASPQARLGSAQNPYYINPADSSRSFANIPSGGVFVDPQGRLRTKP